MMRAITRGDSESVEECLPLKVNKARVRHFCHKENAEFKYYTLYKHKLNYFVGVSL